MYFKTNKFTELEDQWRPPPAWAAAGMEGATSNKGNGSKAVGKEAMRRSTMFQVRLLFENILCSLKKWNPNYRWTKSHSFKL